MVESISAVGAVSSSSTVYTDYFIKSYRYKKEIEYFKENIQNCPTIYPEEINKTEQINSDEDVSSKSSPFDDIENNLSFDENNSNNDNIDNKIDDLFAKLVELIDKKDSCADETQENSFEINLNNNETSNFLSNRKFGPPLGLKIENFDYFEYFNQTG